MTNAHEEAVDLLCEARHEADSAFDVLVLAILKILIAHVFGGKS